MQGRTKSGLIYNVSDELYDDAEFIETLTKFESGENKNFFELMDKMLGEDGKKALYEHVRGENGKVSLTKVSDEIKEIFEALTETQQGKN